MSYSNDFLIFLTSYNKGYKLMRARMGGYSGSPEVLFREQYKHREIKNTTFRATLSRLKKQGLIERDDTWWHITTKGRRFINKKIMCLLPKHSKLGAMKNKSSKNMIVMFDIPEKLHRKRDWLREELIQIGFNMLQKSVWFGPSPLPKRFIQKIRVMDILCYIKFFSANETEII